MSMAVAGKLLIYVAACLLLWLGSRRGWKWMSLDRELDRKTYLRRWGIFFALSVLLSVWALAMQVLLEQRLLVGLEAIRYLLAAILPMVPFSAVLAAWMLGAVIQRSRRLVRGQGAILAAVIFMPLLNFASPLVYWLPCLALAFMKEKEDTWAAGDEDPRERQAMPEGGA